MTTLQIIPYLVKFKTQRRDLRYNSCARYRKYAYFKCDIFARQLSSILRTCAISTFLSQVFIVFVRSQRSARTCTQSITWRNTYSGIRAGWLLGFRFQGSKPVHPRNKLVIGKLTRMKFNTNLRYDIILELSPQITVYLLCFLSLSFHQSRLSVCIQDKIFRIEISEIYMRFLH